MPTHPKQRTQRLGHKLRNEQLGQAQNKGCGPMDVSNSVCIREVPSASKIEAKICYVRIKLSSSVFDIGGFWVFRLNDLFALDTSN